MLGGVWELESFLEFILSFNDKTPQLIFHLGSFWNLKSTKKRKYRRKVEGKKSKNMQNFEGF